jgi:hypothetical protein
MPSLDDLLNTPDTPLTRQSAVNKLQLQGWLKEAALKYADAQRKENSASTRMDAAYDSVFFCALAVLASQSVRVSSKPGHHQMSLEAAAHIMSLPQELSDTVDALRDWRNRKYQAAFTASDADVTDALDTVFRYLEATSSWFQRVCPSLLK